jgi:hypothetical protein
MVRDASGVAHVQLALEHAQVFAQVLVGSDPGRVAAALAPVLRLALEAFHHPVLGDLHPLGSRLLGGGDGGLYAMFCHEGRGVDRSHMV